MDDLLLTPELRAQLQALAKNPPHALLLVGPTGFGKRTIAHEWARLFATPELVEPDEKGTISIDTVRSLYRQTRSKKPGRQVVVIDHAEAMGIEAQNAFLKLLEEPRPGVTFVLTTPTQDALLPTITSRTQIVTLRPLDQHTLVEWLKPHKLSAADTAQFLFIAQGRPATLANLLQNDHASEQRTVMQQAKSLLADSQYARLAAINELTKDRSKLVTTLEAMGTMTKLQLAKSNETRWFAIADGLETCLKRLAQNGNPRAQLTHFFLSY